MKKILILCAFVACAMAAPSSLETAVRRALPALQHEEIHDELGQYALRYVTAEGTIVSERGRLIPNPDGSDYVLVIEGENTYIGDDGKTYVTKYTSGLDGYKVEGPHIL